MLLKWYPYDYARLVAQTFTAQSQSFLQLEFILKLILLLWLFTRILRSSSLFLVSAVHTSTRFIMSTNYACPWVVERLMAAVSSGWRNATNHNASHLTFVQCRLQFTLSKYGNVQLTSYMSAYRKRSFLKSSVQWEQASQTKHWAFQYKSNNAQPMTVEIMTRTRDSVGSDIKSPSKPESRSIYGHEMKHLTLGMTNQYIQ